MITKNLPFLYDETVTLQENFTIDEINLMFDTIYKSNFYLKTIWGDWMKARDMCILAALRYMMLRPKEACCLKFNDLNWLKKQVHIRGENNKESKDRLISLPDKFIDFYKIYMSFPNWMWKNSAYLFPSAENAYLHPQRWKHIFREKILKPAHLYHSGRRSYTLRATGATELLDKGADPWTVAQTLGHGDLRTVKNYYFQTDKYRKNQADWLGKLE